MNKRVNFLNCHFDNIDFKSAISTVEEHIKTREPGFMVSLNTDIIVRIDLDSEFEIAYNAADLALMDSQPLIKLCQNKGIKVKEKLSGSDLMPRVCEFAAKRGHRCFILGGKEGVPDKACENLRVEYPGLLISGYSPEFGFEKDEKKVTEVINIVHEASPDIMFICLGTPKSEKLLYPRLQEFGVPFTFSVGAAVDFAAGNVRRAPLWMQRAGLEWFYRFLQEPGRMFKRYFIDSWRILAIAKKCKELS